MNGSLYASCYIRVMVRSTFRLSFRFSFVCDSLVGSCLFRTTFASLSSARRLMYPASVLVKYLSRILSTAARSPLFHRPDNQVTLSAVQWQWGLSGVDTRRASDGKRRPLALSGVIVSRCVVTDEMFVEDHSTSIIHYLRAVLVADSARCGSAARLIRNLKMTDVARLPFL